MDVSRTTEARALPAVTDAHVHLWDLNLLRYPWLTDQYDPSAPFGPYRQICKTYLIPDFRRDVDDLPVAKFVHIAAAIGHRDPVEETAFIEAHAAESGFTVGIIASVDLRSPELTAQLDRHSAFQSFRGMRALSFGGDLWGDSTAMRNLEKLALKDVLYEIDVQFPHYASAARVARRYGNLRMVIDHAGMPTARSQEHFRAWRDGMRELAAAPNVGCKISGLGVYDQRWTTDSLRPWIETVIELFGPARAMFASDWPVASLYSSYPTLFTAYGTVTAQMNSGERRLLFGATADEWYRI